MAEQFDVVIVGARVGGSPLATLLARSGVKVAVLEQAVFPAPTLSSHVIESDGLAFLARLGLLDRIRETKAPFIPGMDLRINDLRFTADFSRFPGYVGGAACIRRQVLDPILADAAAEAGADVRNGAKVTGLLEENGRVCGVRFVHDGAESQIRARLVVGADGRQSTVAKLRGARRYNVVPGERWYYWTYFEGADLPETPTFLFHRWGDRHIFGAPADNGLYIVGVSPQAHEKPAFRDDRQAMLLEHVRSCEPLAEVVSTAAIADKIYGFPRFDNYFREPSGPGWVLIGDSGHFKDPAAARGIGDAFHQAEWLAPAVVKALHGSDAEIDQATAEFGRWRDQYYSQFYWFASSLGRVGPMPSVLSELVGRLKAKGQEGQVLDVIAHHTAPAQVMTPGRVLAAAARLLLRMDHGRLQFARQVGATMRGELAHKRAARNPVFETAAPEHDAEESIA